MMRLRKGFSLIEPTQKYLNFRRLLIRPFRKSGTLRGCQAFSLIELMVVISIGAILVALGTVSYTTAQRKARDAKRRGDMKAMSSGLEQFMTENGYYDADGTNDGCGDVGASEQLPAGLPADPKPGMAYTFSCLADSYCLCAEMEVEAGNSDAACGFGVATTHYCTTNLQ